MKTIKCLVLYAILVAHLQAQIPVNRDDIRHLEQSHFPSNEFARLHAPTVNQLSFDVGVYLLDLKIYPDQQQLTGIVTIKGISLVNDLSRLEIDLYQHLTVDSVLSAGESVSFRHSGGLISINLAAPINIEESFAIDIIYHGDPEEFTYRSFGWSSHGSNSDPIIWTLSEPYGAPAWWPCKDDPKDKADSLIVIVEVPEDLIVASNGVLTKQSANQGRRTFRWESGYPISTYLVSLAISNYAQFSDWYAYSPIDSMEVAYYVYPEHLSAAQQDLSVTVEMIGFYASVFGPYPFINEKYGMAVFPWGGAMEHQTMTSYGAGLIRGNNYYDWINAHELAHQWFGDLITMRYWSHIWLNEGFASYAEALWYEYKYGEDVYHHYINAFDPSSRPLSGTLFVTDSLRTSALFSRTVYDKGAFVLHMLRGVLGDGVFFQALKDYINDPRFAYGTAVTEDFQEVCEKAVGYDLSWFFEQWVYRPDRPDYEARWSVTEEPPYLTTLHLYQDNAIPYKMPLQVQLSGTDLDTTFTIFDSLSFQAFEFRTSQAPSTLVIDPDNWVLKKLSIIKAEDDLRQPPETFTVSQNYPNPFNPITRIQITLPQTEQVIFQIFNLLGEKIYEHKQVLPAGYQTLRWQGQSINGNLAPSGMYFYRVSSSAQTIIKKMILLR